jgi:hypothetical protein
MRILGEPRPPVGRRDAEDGKAPSALRGAAGNARSGEAAHLLAAGVIQGLLSAPSRRTLYLVPIIAASHDERSSP